MSVQRKNCVYFMNFRNLRSLIFQIGLKKTTNIQVLNFMFVQKYRHKYQL